MDGFSLRWPVGGVVLTIDSLQGGEVVATAIWHGRVIQRTRWPHPGSQPQCEVELLPHQMEGLKHA